MLKIEDDKAKKDGKKFSVGVRKLHRKKDREKANAQEITSKRKKRITEYK